MYQKHEVNFMSFGNNTIDFRGLGIRKPAISVFQAPTVAVATPRTSTVGNAVQVQPRYQIEYDWEINPDGLDTNSGIAGQPISEPLTIVSTDNNSSGTNEITIVQENPDSTSTNNGGNIQEENNSNGEQNTTTSTSTESGMSRGDEEALAQKEDETHVKGGTQELSNQNNETNTENIAVLSLSLLAIGGLAYYLESKNKTFTKLYGDLSKRFSKSVK